MINIAAAEIKEPKVYDESLLYGTKIAYKMACVITAKCNEANYTLNDNIALKMHQLILECLKGKDCESYEDLPRCEKLDIEKFVKSSDFKSGLILLNRDSCLYTAGQL